MSFKIAKQSKSQWLKAKITNKEAITMPDFATSFNYFHERDAHEDFVSLITKSFVSQATSAILLCRYDVWKRNEGTWFWASRAAKLSTTRTAGVLVAEGEHVAKELVQENRMLEALSSTSTSTSTKERTQETHLSDLELCPPYDGPSTTPPFSPLLNSADLGSESLILETPSATSSSSSTAASTISASSTVSVPSASINDTADSPGQELLLDGEYEELLRSVDESNQHLCDWKVDDACLACLFQKYRQACISALVAREITKTDIADLMAVISVFAPHLATKRMLEVFSQRQLESALGPKSVLPEIDIDDANIMKAVRLYLNNKGDEAEIPSMAGNKKLRIMLESLLEYLPLDEDRTISESTFTVKYVAPIIQAYVDVDGKICDFPNTNSTTQKLQNLRPDRPDIRVLMSGLEVLWGEITGPVQASNKIKTLWDTFKLVRFGKSFIADGNDHAPLIQVIGCRGLYMRMSVKVRGVIILEQVGAFTVPTSKAMVPSLVATLPTLELMKVHLGSRSNCASNDLKRSWGHQDVKCAKKLLISDTALRIK
ncbi:hypothetical protein FBU30_004526 [Linnemannia zychae]|nr:hypothetical protein FBU30_004526 [Linnemannia zychae]